MDSENSNGAQTASSATASAPGARLRAAREALGVDLRHVAAETRIPLRHLQAIEDGNFEGLPSRAYAIGFSRTFAKAVGLDPAEITDAVRAELSDGSMRRAVPAPGMAPGDPARLPSSGLAWAAAGAVLILAIGAFAFYRSYFGAGTGPAPLVSPQPVATPPSAAAPLPSPAPAPSGPVVLTATEDGIWVRLFEEGGAQLTERTLARGESVEVPLVARDPRISTARPDALTVTIGGQAAPRIADTPQTLSGAPVSAAALLARGAVAPAGAATPVTNETVPARRPSARRPAARRPVAAPTPVPDASPPAAQPTDALDE